MHNGLLKLTPRSRVLLWKPNSSSAGKNFPTFFRNRSFILVFIKVCHLPLSWARSTRSKPSHSIPLRSAFVWCSWNRASWYSYENNQQDALYRLMYSSKSALHVSGDVFFHHQENLTVFTVSGSVHPSCCRLVSRISIRDTSRQKLGWTLRDTVNTVKCCWWWAKTLPETCRADLEEYINLYSVSCWLFS
jgi:hypothetical protein